MSYSLGFVAKVASRQARGGVVVRPATVRATPAGKIGAPGAKAPVYPAQQKIGAPSAKRRVRGVVTGQSAAAKAPLMPSSYHKTSYPTAEQKAPEMPSPLRPGALVSVFEAPSQKTEPLWESQLVTTSAGVREQAPVWESDMESVFDAPVMSVRKKGGALKGLGVDHTVRGLIAVGVVGLAALGLVWGMARSSGTGASRYRWGGF